jgi:hypothetical protein
VRILEQIGSYAGLAAIPGLAVLSALYFSQARDVRRLREWAGRAPERAAEQAMGGRVAVLPGQAAQAGEGAQPGAAAAGTPGAAQPAAAAAAGQPAAAAGTAGAAAATPAGAGTPAVKPAVAAATAAGTKPATAAAAATGAAPATVAGPAAAGEAATPAGRAAAALGDAEKAASGDGAGTGDVPEQAAAGANGTTEGAEAEEGAGVKQPGKPAALTPAAVASAAAGAAKGPGAARTGPPAVGGVARPGGTPTAGATATRRQIPSLPHSSKTSVLGKGARPVDPWYRRLGARLPAGRYVALIVAGALVLGGGAAFAISQLAGGDDKGSSSSADQSPNTPATPGEETPPKKDENVKATPTVDPSKVTVTVVNGTTIPNLARDTAAKLSQIGFQIGNKVTGTGSLAAAESVVEYRPGAEDEARYVAQKLDISQRQPADPDAIAQAGPAQVIVVLGADQAPGG